MKINEWLVTCYEDLIKTPENEVRKINKYLGLTKEINPNLVNDTIAMTVRRGSAVLNKKDPTTLWKEKLPQRDIDDIMNIVEQFSLTSVYDENFMPRINTNYEGLNEDLTSYDLIS